MTFGVTVKIVNMKHRNNLENKTRLIFANATKLNVWNVFSFGTLQGCAVPCNKKTLGKWGSEWSDEQQKNTEAKQVLLSKNDKKYQQVYAHMPMTNHSIQIHVDRIWLHLSLGENLKLQCTSLMWIILGTNVQSHLNKGKSASSHKLSFHLQKTIIYHIIYIYIYPIYLYK